MFVLFLMSTTKTVYLEFNSESVAKRKQNIFCNSVIVRLRQVRCERVSDKRVENMVFIIKIEYIRNSSIIVVFANGSTNGYFIRGKDVALFFGKKNFDCYRDIFVFTLRRAHT